MEKKNIQNTEYRIQNTNFVFFGTPQIAVETLEILKQNGLIPNLIVTAPDKPQGRKMTLTPPPVRIWAEENNIPVLQPEVLDRASLYPLLTTNYQLFIVVAYGKIFPEWLLIPSKVEGINLPKYGTLNIHYSLLPKYRGASPVQAALLHGEKETGVTIQKMIYELDAGPIIAQEKVKIDPSEKATDLFEKLITAGNELLIKTLPDYIEGKIKPVEQDHSQATKAPKIKKGDGLINLDDDPIESYNKFRAYDPWPGIYFFTNKNSKRIRVKITDAEFKEGKFIIKKIIPEGKKEMDYKDFLKGYSK